jgi:hypothetical protein
MSSSSWLPFSLKRFNSASLTSSQVVEANPNVAAWPACEQGFFLTRVFIGEVGIQPIRIKGVTVNPVHFRSHRIDEFGLRMTQSQPFFFALIICHKSFPHW